MYKQLTIWKLIAQSLNQHIPVTLLYVLESKGSSPGRQGFFMAVNALGEMEGSIGGGIMEHRLVEMAKNKLSESQKTTIHKQIHAKVGSQHSSGMICSGEQSILLYNMKQYEISTIYNIIATLEKYQNATLSLSPEGMKFDIIPPLQNYEFSMKSENDWYYKEKIGYKNILSIIGGGHCSLAFSKLMRQMDFYIKVYDTRNNLKTMLTNNDAHEKQVINNYVDLTHLMTQSPNHYVVIMTFGYRTDDIALRAILHKEFRYLGLLGSKAKINKILVEYKNENIDEKYLKRIFTPVGLNIKSRTPEEIAISIAAEIIREKNKFLS